MGSKRTYWTRGRRGFTLVELLIVIAIIGVISAIAVSMFTKYKVRSYKAVLDYDAKSVYLSAQAYLTDNMGATVDTISELNSGGYLASPHINFVNGNITSLSGNIEIYSNVLNIQGKDNNSVIFANGRIVFANTPTERHPSPHVFYSSTRALYVTVTSFPAGTGTSNLMVKASTLV